MSISATAVRFDEHSMWVDLTDGRTLGVPLAWFPRLLHATAAEREHVQLSRVGLHWEDLDEDISVAGLLAGRGDITDTTGRTNAQDGMKIIDAKAFWGAVGQRALGAAVVTAAGVDGPAGFLGLSTAHVCADPPIMLVSIDKRTSALRAVLESRCFAINYLAHDQQAIADIFGGKSAAKGAERFTSGSWGRLSTGAPILADGAGAIDCALEETIERFGVVIALGRVVDFALSDRPPLILLRGKYVSAAPLMEPGE